MWGERFGNAGLTIECVFVSSAYLPSSPHNSAIVRNPEKQVCSVLKQRQVIHPQSVSLKQVWCAVVGLFVLFSYTYILNRWHIFIYSKS